jgi:hypothetical protein
MALVAIAIPAIVAGALLLFVALRPTVAYVVPSVRPRDAVAQVHEALTLISGRWVLEGPVMIYQGPVPCDDGMVAVYRVTPRMLRTQDRTHGERLAEVWFSERCAVVRARRSAVDLPGDRRLCREVWERTLALETVFAYALARGHGEAGLVVSLSRAGAGWQAAVQSFYQVRDPWQVQLAIDRDLTVHRLAHLP